MRAALSNLRFRRTRGLVPALAFALLAVACGGQMTTTPPSAGQPTPSSAVSASPGASGPLGSGAPGPSAAPASASPENAATYARIEQQVIGIRELRPKSPVDPRILDEAGLRKRVAESFAKDNPTDLLGANERLLKALDLIPPDASLKDLYVSMLGSQVAGMYDPDTKQLYVISRSGAVGPAEKTTFAHEFTHALQDQNFDLKGLNLDQVGQSDRGLAGLSLVEGDAVVSQSYWQLQGLTQAELGALVTGSANDPSTAELLKMPAVLRESLLFPYFQGLAFVQGLQLSGGWQAVDDAYARPPVSTEQILHPEKYAAKEGPVAVDLPKDLATRLGTGWSVPLVDSVGEFELGLWLRESKAGSASDASAAAQGWGGDRVAVANGPNGSWAVVIRTAWDSDRDATEFEGLATIAADHLSNPASLIPRAGGTELWLVIGSDEATRGRVVNVLGLAG